MNDIIVNIAININDLPYGGKRFDEITHEIKVVELYKITDDDELVTNIVMSRELHRHNNDLMFKFKEDLRDGEYEHLFTLDLRNRKTFHRIEGSPRGNLVVHLRLVLDHTKRLINYNGPVTLLDEDQWAYLVRDDHDYYCALNHRMQRSCELFEMDNQNFMDPPKSYPSVVLINEEEGFWRYKCIDRKLADTITQVFAPTDNRMH